MKTRYEDRKEIVRRGWNRCPLCGWRFHIANDWELDEMFCARCETRLLVEDSNRCSRWMAAGVYT